MDSPPTCRAGNRSPRCGLRKVVKVRTAARVRMAVKVKWVERVKILQVTW